VMSKQGAKMGLRRAPLAFTEHGALMAASVLNTPRAVEIIRGKTCGLTGKAESIRCCYLARPHSPERDKTRRFRHVFPTF